MKILLDVYDDHNQIKYEKIIDIENTEIGQEFINAITLAVKKGYKKIVVFIHEG